MLNRKMFNLPTTLTLVDSHTSLDSSERYPYWGLAMQKWKSRGNVDAGEAERSSEASAGDFKKQLKKNHNSHSYLGVGPTWTATFSSTLVLLKTAVLLQTNTFNPLKRIFTQLRFTAQQHSQWCKDLKEATGFKLCSVTSDQHGCLPESIHKVDTINQICLGGPDASGLKSLELDHLFKSPPAFISTN